MISKVVKVNLAADAEARPVAVLVQKASQFESKVYIESGDKKINAKSIMGMMSLEASVGDSIEVMIDGIDEENAMQEITAYLLTGRMKVSEAV